LVSISHCYHESPRGELFFETVYIYIYIYNVTQKTRLLRLIRNNCTYSQHLLIIFGSSILN